MKSSNLITTLIIATSLSGCGLVPPAKPDPATGKLFSDHQFPQKNILTEEKIDLTQYKFLLVENESFKYLGGTLKNMHLPLDVLTPNEFSNYLISHGYIGQNYDVYEMTNYDIKELYKTTGIRYLVWDVHSIPYTVEREINIRVYDPVSDKTYFAAKYTVVESTPGIEFNAVINAFAEWMKKNND